MYYHGNISINVGLFLLFWSIIIFAFSPKFGSTIYGLCTKFTMTNGITWAYGQKRHALSILIMAFIFLALGISDMLKESSILLILFFILSVKAAQYLVDRKVAKKFPNIDINNK